MRRTAFALAYHFLSHLRYSQTFLTETLKRLSAAVILKAFTRRKAAKVAQRKAKEKNFAIK